MKKSLRAIKFVAVMGILVITASCSHKWGSVYTEGEQMMSNTSPVSTTTEVPTEVTAVRLPETGSKPVGLLPNATAFRMSGDYQNNVAVTLAPNGELSYFPAPTDITADSEPISLGKGWWLNRQGIGPRSVFTKYTFAQYAELTETPSIEQLKASIIPGAKVTDFMELPIKLDEATNNPDLAKSYLK